MEQRKESVAHPGVGELGRAKSYHVHDTGNEIPKGGKLTFALAGNQNWIPMVLALNMMDEVKANGGSVRVNELEEILGIPVVPVSAAKNEGIEELIDHAIHVARHREV